MEVTGVSQVHRFFFRLTPNPRAGAVGELKGEQIHVIPSAAALEVQFTTGTIFCWVAMGVYYTSTWMNSRPVV
jgi:hypothetical protein